MKGINISAVRDSISSLCHPRSIFSVIGNRFKLFSPRVSYNRDINLFSHSSLGSAGKVPQNQVVCSKKWKVQSLSSNRGVIHGPGPTPQVIIYCITQVSVSGREQQCFKGAKNKLLALWATGLRSNWSLWSCSCFASLAAVATMPLESAPNAQMFLPLEEFLLSVCSIMEKTGPWVSAASL